MSEYSELNVYKIAYDLHLHSCRFTEKMQRSFRHTLGERINNNTLELLINIYDANSNKNERYELLRLGRRRVERLRLLFRITKDLQILPVKRFVVFNEMVESISKQLTGWQRSTPSNSPSKGENLGQNGTGENGENKLF